MIRTDICHDLDSLLADRLLWDGLTRGVPFRETAWLGPWWRCFGEGKQPYVLVARDDEDSVRGLLPLYRSGASPRGTLSIIGDGAACSDYASVLACEDDAVAAAASMGQTLAAVASDPKLGWNAISIEGVAEHDAPMAAFACALKSAGATLHAHSRMSTWYKSVDANWEAHLRHFGKTQRRKFRRWSEKVESTPGLTRQLATTSAECRSGLDDLIRMHQSRWIAAGKPGSFADPKFCDFVQDTTEEFRKRDRLRLPTLEMNGETIGAELHLMGENRRLYCYSSGYDLNAAEMEPGRILSVETLLDLYRNDLTGIDYLRGDETYKRRMAAVPTRVFQLRAFAPTWFPRIKHAAWWTQFEIEQWVRRRTGRKLIEVADLTTSV